MTRVLFLSAAVAALASPALAQDETDNWTVVFGAATDYRSKGVSKTRGDPYAYLGVEWQSDSQQVYVALDTARVQQSFGSELEVDTTIGWRPEAAGFSFDFSAKYRYHPGADEPADNEHFEFGADVSRSIGPVSGRLRVQYSPDNSGSSGYFTYVEGRLGYRVTPKLRATAAVGHRYTEDAIDYTAWNVGLNYRFSDNVDTDLRWYDTDKNNLGPQFEDAAVFALNFAF